MKILRNLKGRQDKKLTEQKKQMYQELEQSNAQVLSIIDDFQKGKVFVKRGYLQEFIEGSSKTYQHMINYIKKLPNDERLNGLLQQYESQLNILKQMKK